MTMKWKDKNFGKHPADPDYIDDYDPEEDYERYCEALEDKAEYKRENN